MCYSQLRTVEGLGYVVFCSSSQKHDSGFFNILVQSAKFHPEVILSSIMEFFESFYDSVILSNKFEQIFYIALESAERYLTPHHETATDISWRIWNTVKHGNSSYSLLPLQYKYLHKVTPEKFKDFYFRMFLNQSSMKVLSAVMYGKNKIIDFNFDCDISYYSIDPIDSKLDSACT